MGLTPYKPNQGRYARYAVGAAVAALALFAAWRVTRFVGTGSTFPLIGLNVPYGVLWGAGVFAVIGCLAVLFLCAYRTGRESIDSRTSSFTDLLIDTEGELQKVVWPSSDELRRYTIVVIACILVVGGFIYSVDIVVSYTMRGLGVLPM